MSVLGIIFTVIGFEIFFAFLYWLLLGSFKPTAKVNFFISLVRVAITIAAIYYFTLSIPAVVMYSIYAAVDRLPSYKRYIC